jgi:hypothetical protein
MQTGTSLRNIQSGMKVFDSNHDEIGKVEFVQFGDDDPETPEMEARSISDFGDGENTLVDAVSRAFRTDSVPDELRLRLMHQGFVRIDSKGLFASDRYITPQQIDSVADDELRLNVTRDELIKRH